MLVIGYLGKSPVFLSQVMGKCNWPGTNISLIFLFYITIGDGPDYDGKPEFAGQSDRNKMYLRNFVLPRQ
jgi:hypothetical protein